MTLHRLPDILAGDLTELITAVRAYYQAEALKAQDA
jgi:peptide chain release factor 1